MNTAVILAAVLIALVATTTAQNAPAIDWQRVQPIQSTPSFFDKFPVLQRLYDRHQPLTSYLEGTTSARNDFPYQAALVLNRSQHLVFCGGSLISNQWILTVAHCLDSVTVGTAILGAHQVRNAAEVGQQRYGVNQFFSHPGWNGLRLSDDVGLVRLPTAIQFTGSISPVRLSNYRQLSSTYTRQQATLNGFGRGLYAPTVLDVNTRWTFFRVLSEAQCSTMLIDFRLESAQFCAELINGRQCPADAGSPLTVIEADGRHTQIGITSFVTGLGCSSRPAVFTRLNFYLRWIQQTTGIPVADDFTF